MFHSPWFLTLLFLVPWFAWRMFRERERTGIAFSSVAVASRLAPTIRQRLMWLPRALTIAAMTLMIFSIAQPREGREETFIDTDGIAIEMVVDRSGSMQAIDFKIDERSVDRLTAIKKVVADFVIGDDKLPGRQTDLIGLITFAGYADDETPVTLDHGYLIARLQEAEIEMTRGEDGTAIGDAISLAVERLNSLDDRQKQKVKNKIIILLTDGENNAGEMDPIPAAELAQTMGIKVYTIGVGTQGEAPVPTTDIFGRSTMQWMQVNIDEDTLRKVAEITGAKYFRATDTDSLEKIYAEIDTLEKTKVEAQRFTDYRDLAVQSYATPFMVVPPWLLIVFGLLGIRWFLEMIWLHELTAD